MLLTATATPGDSSSCSEHFARSTEAWISAGSQPLSAKVADFGMAMPLGPQDTHATMLARVGGGLGLSTSLVPLMLSVFVSALTVLKGFQCVWKDAVCFHACTHPLNKPPWPTCVCCAVSFCAAGHTHAHVARVSALLEVQDAEHV